MAPYNIVVFGGDHCGPEVSGKMEKLIDDLIDTDGKGLGDERGSQGRRKPGRQAEGM